MFTMMRRINGQESESSPRPPCSTVAPLHPRQLEGQATYLGTWVGTYSRWGAQKLAGDAVTILAF